MNKTESSHRREIIPRSDKGGGQEVPPSEKHEEHEGPGWARNDALASALVAYLDEQAARTPTEKDTARKNIEAEDDRLSQLPELTLPKGRDEKTLDDFLPRKYYRVVYYFARGSPRTLSILSLLSNRALS